VGGKGVARLFAAKCNTALICSRVTENSSITSSTVKPASRFSNTVATGIRVSLNTHVPLTLPGMLSTAGHWDQSRVVIFLPSSHRSCPKNAPTDSDPDFVAVLAKKDGQ